MYSDLPVSVYTTTSHLARPNCASIWLEGPSPRDVTAIVISLSLSRSFQTPSPSVAGIQPITVYATSENALRFTGGHEMICVFDEKPSVP